MKQFLKQVFSFILPITVLLIIPCLIESKLAFQLDPFTLLGLLIALSGLVLMGLTIRMFIKIGKGTLAPWSPTRKLITGSIYGHMRNPMISGALLVLVGEALFFKSTVILIWFLVFLIGNNLYFTLAEEPGLEKRFGEEYLRYKKNVPRWFPRWKVWKEDL